MLLGLTDFGKQRTSKQALVFAAGWILIHLFFAVTMSMLAGSFVVLTMNGMTNAVWGVALIAMLGNILIPTIVGLMSVYHKWGSENILNILLYIAVLLLAVSPLWLLSVVIYAFFAMRPSGKASAYAGAAKSVLVMLIALPVMLLVLAGFQANQVSTSLKDIDVEYEADSRNFQRRSDVEDILFTVHLHAIDHDGSPIEHIPENDIEICRPHASNCEGMLDLAALLDDYPIPVDVSAPPGSPGTRYAIRKTKDPEGQEFLKGYVITVTALEAEGSKQVSASR